MCISHDVNHSIPCRSGAHSTYTSGYNPLTGQKRAPFLRTARGPAAEVSTLQRTGGFRDELGPRNAAMDWLVLLGKQWEKYGKCGNIWDRYEINIHHGIFFGGFPMAGGSPILGNLQILTGNHRLSYEF